MQRAGLGEGARLQLDLLRRIGLQAAPVDLTKKIIPEHAQLPPAVGNEVAIEQPAGAAILHVNPPELALAILAAKLDRSTYRIGYWAYELEEIPREWRAAARLVNEIWTSSRFCADAIRRNVDLPVHVLPYPISTLYFGAVASAAIGSR